LFIKTQKNGGGGGIRTRDKAFDPILTFQASAFNHSATPPRNSLAVTLVVRQGARTLTGVPRKLKPSGAGLRKILAWRRGMLGWRQAQGDIDMKRLMLAFTFALLLIGPAQAETVQGVFALAGKTAAIDGTLAATAQKNGEALDFVFTKPGQTVPLQDFDVELTKQLHVIAISSDFSVFLHDHVARISDDGHFRLVMKFPKPGLYHIYTDGTPAGIGQQVLRFDVQIGSLCQTAEPDLQPTGLSGTSGKYTVRFDALAPVAGQEAMVTLHILKNGQPAPDIVPFLGVPAHAVFIDTGDLSYLHAHPMAIGAKMQEMGGMMMPAKALTGKVDPNFMLHFTPARPGIYKLWLQFNGGGKLRTVPFVFAVK
jgi:hypothetical protein